MIDEFTYSVLQTIAKHDRNPLSLIRDFDTKVCPVLDALEDKGFILLEHGEAYTAKVIYYTLTAKGKDFLTSYCSVCGCMPCDCGYGN